MKALNWLLLVIFVLLNTNIKSQTFEKIIRTPYDDFSFDAVEMADGCFIIAYSRGNYGQNTISGLLKLDGNGNLIDSVFFTDYPEYVELGITDIFPYLNETLLCVRTAVIIENNRQTVNLIQVTSDLQIVYDTIYGSNEYSGSVYGRTLTDDNKLVTVGAIDDSRGNLFIGEFDLTSKTYRDNIITGFPAVVSSTVMEIPENNVYHMYLYWDNNKTFLVINKETLNVDTFFYYPELFLPRNSFKGLTDTSYFAVGTEHILANGNSAPAFIEVNTEGQIVNHFVDLNHSDTSVFYTYNSFDHKYGKIYFGLTFNFLTNQPFPFASQPTWIMICKLTPDGSIVWQRFYKGEVNYNPYKVLATNDGGAFITSTKYDWNDPLGQNLDLHILKIDSTGWYEGLQPVGMDEYSEMKQILVYPNPAHDEVHFEPGLYNDLELQIFDQTGNLLLSESLHSRKTVDVSAFSPGIYIYVIQNKTGFMEKGKLVRE